jgi:AAA domain
MSLTMNLTRTGLGYIYSVMDSGEEVLRFEIAGLIKTIWGIRGRVVIRSRIANARVVPGIKGYYITTETIDFLSGKSRHQLAQRLGELIPAPANGAAIDWDVLVEQMVAQVMDQEHRQPALRDLSEVPSVGRVPYIFPYLLPERKATILYGAGGTGKSAFACALAASIQSGRVFIGNKPQQRNVLYLDWETDEGDVSHRVAAASRGIGLSTSAAVMYMSLELPLEMEMAHIAAAVAENDIGFIVLDSVGMASTQGRDGSDPAEGALQFFRALRILNATVLCIDHISGEDQRKGRQGASKPYGSIFKWNSARNAFELIDSGDEGKVILRHRKSNLGPKMPGGEAMLRVSWNDATDTVTYRRITPNINRITLPERITDALSTGPASYRTLIDLLNSDQDYDVVDEPMVRGASKALLSGEVIAIDHAGVLRIRTQTQEDKESKDAPSLPLALDEEGT